MSNVFNYEIMRYVVGPGKNMTWKQVEQVLGRRKAPKTRLKRDTDETHQQITGRLAQDTPQAGLRKSGEAVWARRGGLGHLSTGPTYGADYTKPST